MGKVIVSKENIKNIADAIRMQGVSGSFTPAEMSNAVLQIQSIINTDSSTSNLSHTVEVTQERISISIDAISSGGYNLNGITSTKPNNIPYITLNANSQSINGNINTQATVNITKGFAIEETKNDEITTNKIAANINSHDMYLAIYEGGYLPNI